MQHYTTVEQSKKLVELGLNPDTADMIIVKDDTYCNALSAFNGATLCQNYSETKNKTNYIPCWSLGALLELIPTSIEEVKGHKVDLILGHPKNKWCLAYFDWTGLQQGHDTTGDSPFEAVYNMVVWLLENSYIKKGE